MLHTIGPSATTLEKIEAILDKAVDVYDKLCTAQVWIKPTCGGGNKLNPISHQVNLCWNRIQNNHHMEQCTQPRNEGNIMKNMKVWQEQKTQTGNNNS